MKHPHRGEEDEQAKYGTAIHQETPPRARGGLCTA